jgi:hypothetical protein
VVRQSQGLCTQIDIDLPGQDYQRDRALNQNIDCRRCLHMQSKIRCRNKQFAKMKFWALFKGEYRKSIILMLFMRETKEQKVVSRSDV